MAFDVSFVYRIIDKFSKPLDKIQRKSSKFAAISHKIGVGLGRAAGKSVRGLNVLGNKMKEVGSRANSLAASIGTLAFAFPIKKAMSFENALTDMDKVMEFKSAGQRREFISDLKSMGPLMGQNATNMALLATEAAKMGVSVEEASKFVEIAAKAKSALDLADIAQAGNIVGDLKQKFGLGVEGVELMLDAVNKLSDSTATTAADILEVSARTSGLFSSLKIPPEVSAGLSAFAREISVSPELAASGLKQFTQKLIEMGQGAALSAKPVETIQKVVAKFKNAPQEVLQDAFGREAAPFVAGLIDKSSRLAEVVGMVGEKTKFAGSMTDEFNRKMSTKEAKLAKIKAQFDNIVISIGEHLLPVVDRFATALGPILEKVRLWVEQNPRFTKMALAVAAITAVVLPLIGALGFVVVAVTAISAPVAAVVAGFGLLAAGVVAFWDDLKGVRDWIESAFLAVWDKVQSKISSVTSVISRVGDFFGLGDDVPTISDQPLTPQKDLAAEAAINSKVNISGSIGVEGRNGAKVTDTKIKTDAPGNVGFNVGLVPG